MMKLLSSCLFVASVFSRLFMGPPTSASVVWKLGNFFSTILLKRKYVIFMIFPVNHVMYVCRHCCMVSLSHAQYLE